MQGLHVELFTAFQFDNMVGRVAASPAFRILVSAQPTPCCRAGAEYGKIPRFNRGVGMRRDDKMDVPIGVSKEGYAGRLGVIAGPTGRQQRSDAEKARIAVSAFPIAYAARLDTV